MTWTFLILALWLKDGTPEPHVVTILPGLPCDTELATGIAQHFIDESGRKDSFLGSFDFSCVEAVAPKAAHVPGKGEA